MKKLLLSAAVVAALSTTSLMAGTDLHMGVSSATIKADNMEDISGTEYTIGYGFDNRKGSANDRGVYWGGSFDLGYASLDDVSLDTMYSFTADLKLGYSFNQSLAIYGIGSAGYQTLKGDTSDLNSLGFGYGAGVDYKVAEHLSVAAEYKKYSMTIDENGYAAGDYDYDKFGVNFKYLF